MEEPFIDDYKKLETYGFKQVGEWKLLDEEDTISLEKSKNEDCKLVIDEIENCKPIIYAIVIGHKAKYIGSTTRGKKRGFRLQFGKYRISNLKRGLTRSISEELKRSHKRTKLYCLKPRSHNHKGLRFPILRDLENALINEFKTTKEYDCWNKKVDN